jgi:hypothetical protein
MCGERVCQACLRAITLPAESFRARAAPGRNGKAQGLACSCCLWELLTKRGVPPPFPEPPGHRRAAAKATCEHPEQVRWMRCCPDCGVERWQADPDAPSCDACGAPSDDLFNACWSCGESFEEDHDPRDAPPELDRPCSSRACAGRVAWPMPHCPWCAAELIWPHTRAGSTCLSCDAPVDPTWAHCTACGADAPLPERCVECDGQLDQAECAARCEACRHLVCGECFGNYALAAPDEPAAKELLLCLTCADELGAQPLAEDEADDDEPAADASPDDPAEDPAETDAREAETAEEAPPAAEPPAPSAWEVLGVAPGVPLAEIRQAYLRLVSQYHPDKVAQLGPKLQALALEETRRLNLAWSELREQAGSGRS